MEKIMMWLSGMNAHFGRIDVLKLRVGFSLVLDIFERKVFGGGVARPAVRRSWFSRHPDTQILYVCMGSHE
jgi:hypothetical protein